MRFSWQAQASVRLRGVAEVTVRGRRSTLRALDVRRVDTESFVAVAGNRDVASCGGGDCRCDIGIGV